MSMNIILKYGLAYRFVIVIYFMLPIKYIYIYIYDLEICFKMLRMIDLYNLTAITNPLQKMQV